MLLLLPFLLAACTSERDRAAPEPAAEGRIFRFVELGPRVRFELGAPLGNPGRLVTQTGPNLYRLRDDAISGAESIVVETDDAGIVRRIRFAYGSADAWRDMLSFYSDQLGAAMESSATELVWNDGRTEFRLHRDADADHAAGAQMRDLTTVP